MDPASDAEPLPGTEADAVAVLAAAAVACSAAPAAKACGGGGQSCESGRLCGNGGVGCRCGFGNCGIGWSVGTSDFGARTTGTAVISLSPNVGVGGVCGFDGGPLPNIGACWVGDQRV